MRRGLEDSRLDPHPNLPEDPTRAFTAPGIHPTAARGESARGHRPLLGHQDLHDRGGRRHLRLAGQTSRVLGFFVEVVLFCTALYLQFRSRRYSAV